MLKSPGLMKLQILMVVANNEGIRSPELQRKVFLSSSQLRRYTQQLERAGLLIIEQESSSAIAAFVHYLGPNTTRTAIAIAHEALQETNDGLADLKCLAAAIDSRIKQLERRIDQLFETSNNHGIET